VAASLKFSIQTFSTGQNNFLISLKMLPAQVVCLATLHGQKSRLAHPSLTSRIHLAWL